MGEIANQMIEGKICTICGCKFKKQQEVPSVCPDCWKQLEPKDKNIHCKSNSPTI